MWLIYTTEKETEFIIIFQNLNNHMWLVATVLNIVRMKLQKESNISFLLSR